MLNLRSMETIEGFPDRSDPRTPARWSALPMQTVSCRKGEGQEKIDEGS